MSFYGNLSDRSRTDLKFDKIYPNRFIMEQNAATDGIFVGRYVLINYEDGYNEILTENTYNNFYCIEKEKGNYEFWSDYTIDVKNGEGVIYSALDATTLSDIKVDFPKGIAFKTGKNKHLFNFNLENKYFKFKINLDTKKLEIITEVDEEVYQQFWGEENSIFEFQRPVVEIATMTDGKQIISSKVPMIETIIDEEGNEITQDEIIYYNPKEENDYNITILKLYAYHCYEIAEEEKIWVMPYNENKKRFETAVCAGVLPEGDSNTGYFQTQNGKINFRIDEYIYGINKRGYHSTVWEKIYINENYKYIKIAELNTYIPTIDLKSNAPTSSPKKPHLAPYGDNINYELDWQPSWGFRIKSADTNIRTRKYNEDGFITSKNGYGDTVYHSTYATNSINKDDWIYQAGPQKDSFKSDVNVNWDTQFYDEATRTYNKYYFDYKKLEPGYWKEATKENQTVDIPAAIYFNKDGFNKNISHYSSGNHLKPDPINTKNYIRVEPTGRSGRVYSDNVEMEAAPDTQELSIMLPVLGDTVAEMWDLIYGNSDAESNLNQGQRNTKIDWKDAKYVDSIRQGLRLTNFINPYDTKSVETLAGCINTAHDLIGMIISPSEKDVRELDVNELSEHFIYYNKIDKTYYQKKPYTKITPLSASELNDIYGSKDKMFNRVDTENLKFFNEENQTAENEDLTVKYFFREERKDKKEGYEYNYILDQVYHPDKEYVIINPEEKKFVDVYEEGLYYIDKYNNKDIYELQTKDYDETKADKYLKIETEDFEYNGIYMPECYYFEIPRYEEKNEEIIKSIGYVLDTTENGYVFPTSAEVFKTEWGLETIDTKDYLSNYSGKGLTRKDHFVYYLPKTVEKEDRYITVNKFVPLVYNKDYEYLFLTKSLYDKLSTGTHVVLETPPEENKIYYTKKSYFEQNKTIEVDNQNPLSLTPYKEHTFYFLETKNSSVYRTIDTAKAKEIFIPNENGEFAQSYYKIVKITDTIEMNLYGALPPYFRILEEKEDYAGSYVIVEEELGNGNDKKYFTITDIKEIKLFNPYNYYTKDNNDSYILIKNENDFNINKDNIFIKKDIRVFSDDKKIHAPGEIWNPNIPLDNSITLGVAEDSYKMTPMIGFARNVNTMLGLIVKINTIINENNPYTRDRETIQGTINCMNDIINKIDELYPNELVFTDQFGRIHAPKDSLIGDKYISAEIKDSQVQINHLKIDENNYEGNIPTDDTLNVDLADEEFLELLEDDENLTDEEREDIEQRRRDYNISFTVPYILYDDMGHMYKSYEKTYKIPIYLLAGAAVQDLERRVDAIERNAIRVYKEGIVTQEDED